MTGIVLFGSQGRMGRLIGECAGDGIHVVAGYDTDPPGLDVSTPLPDDADVVVDFSSHAAWTDLDRLLESTTLPLVSGTTGLGPAQLELLRKWSTSRVVFHSANMSLGVFVLGRLLETAGEMLSGSGFDLEIVEKHHRNKLDSPSGTALHLLERWRSAGAEVVPVHGRKGRSSARTADEVGIHSVRGGDIVGQHSLLLLGPGEMLELSHTATSRETFARGALAAVEYVLGVRRNGLYGMRDLLEGGGDS